MSSWQKIVSLFNDNTESNEEGSNQARDGSEQFQWDSYQTEVYSQVATLPPDSDSKGYESSYSNNMFTKAKIKIEQPTTFDGKASDASY